MPGDGHRRARRRRQKSGSDDARHGRRLLAKAIGWADAGAPFVLIAPGPSLASEAQHR
jgi:hypothetical protein